MRIIKAGPFTDRYLAHRLHGHSKVAAFTLASDIRLWVLSAIVVGGTISCLVPLPVHHVRDLTVREWKFNDNATRMHLLIGVDADLITCDMDTVYGGDGPRRLVWCARVR